MVPVAALSTMLGAVVEPTNLGRLGHVLPIPQCKCTAMVLLLSIVSHYRYSSNVVLDNRIERLIQR
jgi:hypothetical protein